MATAWASQLATDNDKDLDHYYREYHQELCRYAVSKFGLSYSEAPGPRHASKLRPDNTSQR